MDNPLVFALFSAYIRPARLRCGPKIPPVSAIYRQKSERVRWKLEILCYSCIMTKEVDKDKMNENNSTMIYVRLPNDVLEELDVRCARLRMRRPAAVCDAVRGWLTALSSPLATPKRGHSGPLHEQLAQIESSGDAAAKEIARHFLDFAASRTRPSA